MENPKKGKDFTSEERDARQQSSKGWGKIAAEEVGTIPQVVSGLMARGKKKTVKTIDIVPGQDGLPEKRATPYTHTHMKNDEFLSQKLKSERLTV